jgi:hypothetical protein
MAYADINFKTKKALKEAVKDYENGGPAVTYHSPGPFGVPENGPVSLEGPHYPKPHSWYASCLAENGRIVKVK